MSRKWLQTADWKSEKHVPVIEAPDSVKKGELVEVNVSVGKEIHHPNTTAHHIKWVDLFLWPEGEKFPIEIGYISFDAHGESAQGPDTGTIYTEPFTKFAFKTEKSGTLMATAYCNIHGLWKSEKELKVE
ncbi:MAG: class II SORL domain-containing protein [Candidatus Thorarchaeota archaeon]|nr:MAG: Neelaredoxin [Candidatus Thorarchaeota archaeon]RLI58838.1 MAG: Neelaredoxin [Candidatus Thorarchaeota archaeon]